MEIISALVAPPTGRGIHTPRRKGGVNSGEPRFYIRPPGEATTSIGRGQLLRNNYT